jgi:ABC transporter substrate binding protein
MLAAGRALGVEIMIVECRDDSDYEAAMAKMAEGGAGGMILGSFVLPNLNKVVSLAALHKLPTIYPFRALARAGGLMSYDADILDLTRHVGSAYVARILKGAKPADLPVEQPTKFDLVINLKTARALELEVPSTLVALADEVVEQDDGSSSRGFAAAVASRIPANRRRDPLKYVGQRIRRKITFLTANPGRRDHLARCGVSSE